MPSIEQTIKEQYEKVFVVADWGLFKQTAEAQLREAAYIRIEDMPFERLLLRIPSRYIKRTTLRCEEAQ